MQFYRPLKLYFVVLLMCLSVVAQSPTPTPTPDPEAEKAALELEKGAIGLLDEAVAEAATLRLPENRALILTMAADALWSRDEKRARELFHQASDQVIAVVNSAPTGNSQIQQLILPFGREDLFSLRQMLLMTLARYDADLALEYLAATRPPDVAAELQEYYGSKSGSAARRSFFKAERELRFEESLIAQTTVQDPEKAAKLVRESLAKGQSSQILGLIFKIAEKDVGLANTLIGEVFSKTIESDLSKSINDYFFAISLLRTFSQPLKDSPTNKSLSKLRADERLLKDLSVKIADRLASSTSFTDLSLFASAVPLIERFAPEKSASVKIKQAALKKQAPDGFRSLDMPQSVTDPATSSAQLISDAAKADPAVRGIIYRTAAMRAVSGADIEKTRAQLQDLPQSKERDDAIAVIDVRLAQMQLSLGKIDDARRMIDRMPPGIEKIRQIVQLAVASSQLATEDGKENANLLMDEARRAVRDYPEDRDDADALIALAAGYAVIDPERAFAILGPIIGQSNDVINANALIAKYYKQDQLFREGEMLMTANLRANGSRFYRYGREIGLLARADLDRTKHLIDQFSRADVRVFVKAFIAQGILNERVGFTAATLNE
ncbi:MAG: hypothetical protein IPJ30_10510 [Acidobacteria bacterium]|nr:hypothetical protein [Acidobacteriota bacterium]